LTFVFLCFSSLADCLTLGPSTSEAANGATEKGHIHNHPARELEVQGNRAHRNLFVPGNADSAGQTGGMPSPTVRISSHPLPLRGTATFRQETREFTRKHDPRRDVPVISHIRVAGEDALPLIDMTRRNWAWTGSLACHGIWST
jgi:hypothetical protein